MKTKGGYNLKGNILEYFSIPEGSLLWVIHQLESGQATKASNGYAKLAKRVDYAIDILEYPGRIPVLKLTGWTVDKGPTQRPIWSEL
jgi:hypothetical protein